MALAISMSAIAPFVKSDAVLAQSRQPSGQTSQQLNTAVAAGTTIQVRFNDAEKVIVMPDETKALTLEVSRAVTSRNGSILIPAGSQLVGQLQPARNGSQFVANQLIINPGQRLERRYSLNGRSRIVTRTERIRKGASTRGIVTGAAVGGAAAAAIAALTGDRALATEEILGGAGLGAIAGIFLNRRQVDVVVVYPNQDLAVRLDSELALR